MRTLILYVFHQINENVEIFIEKGIFFNENYDFVVICNSLTLDLENLEIPSYVKIVKRENIGFDFGAWSDVLITDELYKNYDYFVFINSSVSGPYIPLYYKFFWPNIFTEMLNDEIKLSGVAINCGNTHDRDIKKTNDHVQSYVFSTDRIGMEILLNEQIFTKNYLETFIDVINNQEIRMSRVMINNGFNIACLLRNYQNVDFRTSNFIPEGDKMHPSFFDKFIYSPFELVFIKTNRGNQKCLEHIL